MKRLLYLSLLLSSFGSAFAAEAKRPNILFAFADDWGRYASAYAKLDGPGTASDIIRTPAFDRVAKEGVLFRQAFVSAPSCTPCRSALLSGQHFWRTGRGSILRGAIWDGSSPAYPLMLQESGYHIGKMYKVWGPGSPNDAPYGEQKNAFQKAGGDFNDFSENVTKMVAAGKPLEAAKQAMYDQVGDNFSQFLAARKEGQPFCFWFGPTNVHRKWTAGSGKALWNLNPDDLKGKMPPFLPDAPELRQDFADYLGEAQAFDAALALLIKKIEDAGELDNTIIVVSGDHGAPGFAHGKCNLYDFGVEVALAIRWGGAKGGRVVDDLISLTDLAPTFLEAGGVKIPEVMTGRSLMPLLTSEKAGQLDPARKTVFFGRERHVESARADYLPYPQRAIRTPDHLLIINFKPDRYPMGDPWRVGTDNPPNIKELTEDTRVAFPDDDSSPSKAWLVMHREDPQWKPYYDRAYGKRPRIELYDLAKDPQQMNNVAGDAAYAAVRDGLEKRLMDELKQTGDPRVIDDGKFYETAPMAGPLAEPKGGTGKGGKGKGKNKKAAD